MKKNKGNWFKRNFMPVPVKKGRGNTEEKQIVPRRFPAGGLIEQAPIQPPSPEIMEKVLLSGNLADLDVTQRLSYYESVCRSLGLNPVTKPFEYITLQGKMVLYAKKDCTDQLRRLYGVSIKILSRDISDGMIIVTALKWGGDSPVNHDEAKWEISLDALRMAKVFYCQEEENFTPDSAQHMWLTERNEAFLACVERDKRLDEAAARVRELEAMTDAARDVFARGRKLEDAMSEIVTVLVNSSDCRSVLIIARAALAKGGSDAR